MLSAEGRIPPSDPFLVLADDWPGAWDQLDFERPDDWREVAPLLAWDLAAVCGAWVHLEASHQDPVRLSSIRDRADVVVATLRDDLPFLLDVGPSTPAGPDQPQLPMLIGDDPALERLTERPEDLSWRTYFAMPLHLRTQLVLGRAGGRLRARWLADRGVDVDQDAGTEEVMSELRRVFGVGADLADVQRWTSAREQEDRALADRVGAQVALQVECLLRDQTPTVLPLVEEGLSLHLDDAALGAALHVRVTGEGDPQGLCLVSHDGRPRAVLPTHGTVETDLRTLVDRVAR